MNFENPKNLSPKSKTRHQNTKIVTNSYVAQKHNLVMLVAFSDSLGETYILVTRVTKFSTNILSIVSFTNAKCSLHKIRVYSKMVRVQI